MGTKYLIFTFIFLTITAAIFGTGMILAQEATDAANIQYPVEELGNCQSQTDCRAYCDKPDNLKVCLNFAKENNLMSGEELEQAEKFLEAGGEGPGGCTGKDECEEYCNDISHIDECISFAEENNLIPPEELEEAKRVQAAIKRGVNPPPCGNKRACDAYCEEPEHMEECIAFGLEAGFIQGKEAEDAQKMLRAVRRGIKPPPCKGKEACDEYCSEPENMEVCMNFALEAGFMSEEEKADSEKMLQALKKGIKPPQCRGKEECDIYCSQEEHFEECMNFAVAAGFMSEEDAAMARKTGGKSPGDCKGKEECEAFCNNPDNQEICLNFAIEHGLIPEQDLEKMEEGRQRLRESLNQAPQEVIDCLEAEVGQDLVEKMKNGVMPPRDVGDKIGQCFQRMGPPEGPGNMPPQAGPGGCKTPEECQQYCENNPEECKNFQPGPGEINPSGQGPESAPPQQASPSGCKTPEECQSFCQNNPEQCQNFRPPEGQESQMPPGGQIPPAQYCEGENCQYGPPPEGQLQAIPEEFRSPDEILPQKQQQPPPEFQQEPPYQNEPPPSLLPSESPLPASSIINTDSLVGSLIYAAFKFLITAR